MLNKLKLFLQKHMIIIFLILFSVIALLITLLALVFRQRPITKLVDKTNDIITKSLDKINDINVKKTEIDITKKIELQKNDNQKVIFSNKIDEIKALPDRKERLRQMIKLNNSIKVPND